MLQTVRRLEQVSYIQLIIADLYLPGCRYGKFNGQYHNRRRKWKKLPGCRNSGRGAFSEVGKFLYYQEVNKNRICETGTRLLPVFIIKNGPLG